MTKLFSKDKRIDFTRDFTSFGNSIILVLLTLLVTKSLVHGAKVILGLVIINVIASALKVITVAKSPRKEIYKNIFDKIDAGKFPSMHTSRSSFVMLSWIETLLYPYSLIPVFLIPYIAYTRLKLKNYDLVDTAGGLIIGFIMYKLLF